MAKNIKTENNVEIVSTEVQLVSDKLETKLKNNLKVKKEDTVVESLGEVTMVQIEKPKVAPVRMSKVLMACDHKCCVGGEWYYLLKDKQYNVPDNVKTILVRANKLKPL